MGKKSLALVPTKHPGVQIGRRHYPSGSPFMNGPTWGKDVFIPLEWIMGGIERAGKCLLSIGLLFVSNIEVF